MSSAVRVGVLALQGGVREHLWALEKAGAEAVPVRSVDDLASVAGLVIPGGESTTIGRLLNLFGLLEPVREAVSGGLPTYGSCAGMILLADSVLGGLEGQPLIGGLDAVVRRNAFGSQVDSFEATVPMEGIGDVAGVFIRAPWVERLGPRATALAVLAPGHGAHPADEVEGRVVAVRQEHLLATSFHPELTGDHRVHSYFIEMVQGRE